MSLGSGIAPLPPRSSSPRVSVVDDDPAALDSFGALLESAGYDVRLYGSCEDFLSSDISERGQVLLLDARFPNMAGLDLLARLRDGRDHIPTLFVMGRFDQATRLRAMRDPAVVRVLDKPVDTSELLTAVKAALTG